MLTRDECDKLELVLHKEISTRSALGGYSPEAGTILMLCQLNFELLRHIKETLPASRKPKKDKSE